MLETAPTEENKKEVGKNVQAHCMKGDKGDKGDNGIPGTPGPQGRKGTCDKEQVDQIVIGRALVNWARNHVSDNLVSSKVFDFMLNHFSL